ncbi:peptidoglycan DD-metalloendopeptidase family protein [Bowdeniella massiliensis]|uniref:peptidoglycan DD-metalloendopeptidase family protein n=1 Tax=Bowdeniella massiliensis TaxID=2932264 RepID=UPI0020281216|nr:peptidoglycan DD-metalloendopeptidase family protein [Bowdeniella massiliensis]
MPVVGIAEVLIRPTFKGMQQDIGKEFDDLAKNPAATKTGSVFGGKVATAAKKAMKAGAVATGAAVGGIIATGLKKGFDRLQAIEQAKAKLVGLGHSAKSVETIMGNALASVKGTAFGLGEAATVAANAVAAGVKPGKELERTLKLVADTSTIAGRDMGEMGAIFNKVAASNKVQMDVINQLHDAGVPALSLIAKHIGKTSEETAKMASKGEIDFATFQAAMEKGVGGAALESGKTLSGSFNNALAALGRAGANLLSGVYPKFQEFFSKVIDWMEPIEDLAKRAGEKIAELLDDAIAKGKDAVKWLKENENSIKLVASALAGAATAWGLYKVSVGGVSNILKAVTAAQAMWNAVLAANPIMRIVTVIGALVGSLIYLYNTNEDVKNAIDSAWNWIKDTISTAWNDYIKPAWDAMSGFVTNTLVPIFQRIRDVAKQAWEGIKNAVATAWSYLQPVFNTIGSVIQGIGSVFQWLWINIIQPIWGLISWWIQVQWNVLRLVFDLIVFAIKNVGSFFSWLYNNVIKPVWDWISNLISSAWNNYIKPVFSAIGDFLQRTLGPAFTWFRDTIVAPVWNGIKDTISSIWTKGIKPVLQAFGDFFTKTLPGWVQRGAELIGDAWNGVKNFFAVPINWVLENVWDKGIKKAFDNVAKAVGSGARLPAAGRIGGTKASSYGLPSYARRARGGYTHPGWTLVGEEGPELVNFTQPNRVYTAAETAKALAAGRDLDPRLARQAVGRTPRESMVAAGGISDWASSTWGAIKSGAKWAWDNTGGRAIKWVRGGLAKAADFILRPLQALISRTVGQWGHMGSVVSGMSQRSIDALVKWIRGHDEQAIADGGAEFVGTTGGFARPSRGPITSWYGPRWGAFHAGVDIAGGGPTYAAWNGKVAKTGWNIVPGRTGIGILLSHGGSKWTYYGHNPVGGVVVKPGQEVKAGQRIGAQGATGNVTGVHLHFEEHRGGIGRAVNPGYLFRDRGGNLPPGLSMVLNNTGRDEWILNDNQMRALAARAQQVAAFPDEVTLQVGDEEFPAYLRRKTDERLTEHVADLRQSKRQLTGV